MTPAEKKKLLSDLQVAVEIELTTIPVYLYTYYSINRQPAIPSTVDPKRAAAISYYANKAGAVIMSVAVEEMLHMSLSSNVLRSLGGMPKLTGNVLPKHFPVGLPRHKKGFAAPLSPLTHSQLNVFLAIEKPDYGEKPSDKNWDTIGQFYADIIDQIKKTKVSDYGHAEYQLAPGKGYYAPNNVDTIYPDKKTGKPVYTNAHDSGDLVVVNGKEAALLALKTVCHQGEGYGTKATTKFDDKTHEEETHYFKYLEIQKELSAFTAEEQAMFVHPFQVNPKTANYPGELQPLSNLVNAVYTYIFMMSEACYRYADPVQSEIFNAGMHKAMIFILDKLCGQLRGIQIPGTNNVMAPTFEPYHFNNATSAKEQMISMWQMIPPQYQPEPQILERIKVLPDVDVAPGDRIRF